MKLVKPIKIGYLTWQKLEYMRRNLLVLAVILISCSLIGLGQQQEIKIACVGNSITFGSGISNRDQHSYPAQLQYWLGDDYEVKNFGVGGTTMLKKGNKPYWIQPEFQQIKDYQPDIIIIKLGTNDSKPQNWQYSSDFETDYKQMIDEFAELKSRPRIMLALPVPVFIEEKWGINQAVVRDEILPIVEKVGKSRQCDIIDLYHPLEDYGRYFPDQIHPDPLGAELIVKEIYLKLFHKTSSNRGASFNTATHPVPSPEYRGAAAGWGEGKDWFSQHEDINQIGKERQLDLVFLGNSITQSWGGEGRSVGSPVRELWDSLYSARNAANFGISGDRTQHILWRIDNGNFDAISPQAVILTIGVNNFRNNSSSEISAGIKLIISRLKRKLPSTHIILLGPLPSGADESDPMREKYQQVHQQISGLGTQSRVTYMKISEPFILANGDLNYDFMRTDNIHLTAQGYYQWASLIEPELKKIFND